LCQPLAAASNYIGAARILVGSRDLDHSRAAQALENAESQIMRAADIVRRIGRTFDERGNVRD
jgi:phosphoglycerate-specific signal transduction histidine kinase